MVEHAEHKVLEPIAQPVMGEVDRIEKRGITRPFPTETIDAANVRVKTPTGLLKADLREFFVA